MLSCMQILFFLVTQDRKLTINMGGHHNEEEGTGNDITGLRVCLRVFSSTYVVVHVQDVPEKKLTYFLFLRSII